MSERGLHQSLDDNAIWQRLDSLTKPPRSLGKLEHLAARLCRIQQTLTPVTSPRRVVLFAGDHGVVASGVSAWPSSVTSLMIDNIRGGGAASSVLARQTSAELRLVDVGSQRGADQSEDVSHSGPECGWLDARVRAGTRDLAVEPALEPHEFQAALAIGQAEADRAARDGMKIVAAGEMGIGNTTPAACLAMLLADVPLEAAVGRGAGADDAVLETKRRIVEVGVTRARSLVQPGSDAPIAAMASVAGLEIVAMAGFFLGAHAARLTIVLDGYVATAAALIAERLQPGTAQSMIAAHVSAEPGHQHTLNFLKLTPFLDWNMRLGEGTGALLLLPLIDAAAALCREMATFESAGIVRRTASTESDGTA